MRVSRIIEDASYIGERTCRVFCNESEVFDWLVADEFRRVIETPSGPRFGSIRVALQPEAICEPPETTQQASEVSEGGNEALRTAKPRIPARKRKASK